MKRSLSLVPIVLLIGSVLAGASTLISKQEAEQHAIVAVGGGTVTQALKEKELGKIIWSVDVVGATNEYEVWLTLTREPLYGSSRSLCPSKLRLRRAATSANNRQSRML